MQGESLHSVELGPTGAAGDRRFGVQDQESGRVLSAKREGRLLLAAARTADPVAITLPTGESLGGPGAGTDAALSRWLGRPLRLVEADGETVPTFEGEADPADDDPPVETWQGRPGGFVDSSPVHLLTTAGLRAVASQRPDLDWRLGRFRPTLLVDAPGDDRVEDTWPGRRCTVGDVELEIVKACGRCVMTTRPQPGGLDRQLEILGHLSRVAGGTFGVLARVVRPGTVSVGAAVGLR